MKFYWKAMLAAISTAAGVIGVAYLVGEIHTINIHVLGFFVALAVFIEGVDHLSGRADQIVQAIGSVEASLPVQEDE